MSQGGGGSFWGGEFCTVHSFCNFSKKFLGKMSQKGVEIQEKSTVGKKNCQLFDFFFSGYPPQMGEMLTGTYLFSGLSAAIFQKVRTNVGEFVEVNLKRTAIYSQM